METNKNKKIKAILYKCYKSTEKYYLEKKERNEKFRNLRINSLDVIRGILVVATIFLICQGLPDHISPSFELSKGEGLNFADVVLPMFLLAMGCSIPFFVKKYHTDGETVAEIIKRSSLRFIFIFLLGIIYSIVFLKSRGILSLVGPYQMVATVYIVCILVYLGFLKLKIKNNALTYVFFILATLISLIFFAIFQNQGMDANLKIFLACISAISVGMYGMSLGLILNKKPIKKKYIRYRRPKMIKNNGWSRENLWIDIKSYLNPRSIRSILSNYYRFNKDAKKLVNIFLLGWLLYLASRILEIWIPLDRSIFNISFNMRVASYIFFIEFILYALCDILKLRFVFNMLQRIGENAILVILLVSLVHKILGIIKLKSLYRGSWMGLNSWFTTDFILPITGIELASTTYAIVATIIWCLVLNLLDKYDIRVNI